MPSLTFKERKKINHELKTLGFGGLEDRNLFSQIASLYRTDDSFRGLLMSTAPDQRRIAYEALKPHLSFKAKPLEDYETETKLKAEREQWDVYDGTHFPKPFDSTSKLSKFAEQAIARDWREKGAKGIFSLVCRACTFEQSWKVKRRTSAIKLARADGWMINGKETLCRACKPTVQ